MELDAMKAKLANDKEALSTKIAEIESKQKELEEKKVTSILGTGGEANKAPDVITSKTRMGSYEQKLLGTFRAKNFKELVQTNTSHPRYKNVSVNDKVAVMQVKEAVDISRYIAQIYYGGTKDPANFMDGRAAAVKSILESNYAKEHLVPLLKSFNSGAALTGGDWVPTIISSSYQEEYELEFELAAKTKVMPMPSNPFELPVQQDVTTARIIGEGVPITDANFQTSVIQWNAQKTGEYYIVPSELDEDSAPPILAIARGEVTRAQIRAREQVLLNGDDSVTHMDNDTAGLGADVAQKLAKGYRKLAIDNGATIDFNGTVDTTGLDQMRIAMGKFGVNVKELLYVFGPTGYGQAVSLAEVSSVDQIGNAATLLTGALAAYRGIPIIVSEFVREDLALSGINTLAGPNDKTVCHIINASRFWLGVRRPIMTKIAVSEPDEDSMKLASYSRWDFKGHAQTASEVSTVLGLNISLS